MPRGQRRAFAPEFKAKLVLELLSGAATQQGSGLAGTRQVAAVGGLTRRVGRAERGADRIATIPPERSLAALGLCQGRRPGPGQRQLPLGKRLPKAP